MLITKTARQKIENDTGYFGYTLSVYRDALQYVTKVVMGEWVNLIEKLIHTTARSKAVYADFDQKFFEFHSYPRRMVIAEAIGHVSSHHNHVQKWQANSRGKEPNFQPHCNSFPVFCKEVMYEWLESGKVRLKLHNGSDWIWFTVPFEPINIEKRFPLKEGWDSRNPVLVQKGRRWRFHFPFERGVTLKKKAWLASLISLVRSVSHGDSTVPVPYPRQCHFRKETATITT